MNTIEIEIIASTLRKAGDSLSERPLSEIIDAIDQVASFFLNPVHPLRQKAEERLSQSSSKEMAQFVINDLFQKLTKPALTNLLEEELKDPSILDGPRPKQNGVGFTRAYGPRLITHILPGNIPGIAVESLVFALLVKSASLAKMSSKAPSLLPLFIQALLEVDKRRDDARGRDADCGLAQSIALIPWENEPIETTAKALEVADLVILYGSDQTIETLRPFIPPQTKTIIYGPKVSLGIIARENISREVAVDAAWDIALYDQKGCLSPHLYYVEESGKNTALTFSMWVAEALETIPLPKGPTAPEDASAIQQLRGTIPLKGGTVFASKKGVDWTVLYDPDPAFTISPLSRTVFIKPVKDINEIPLYLEPMRFHLQAVGLAAPKERTAALLHGLGGLGVCRICPIGQMQKLPLNWHHDGRFRILDLLRFVDVEGESHIFPH